MIQLTAPRKRIRINVSTSVKGIKTYEVTVEMADTAWEEVVMLSDVLVEVLDKRYPAPGATE